MSVFSAGTTLVQLPRTRGILTGEVPVEVYELWGPETITVTFNERGCPTLTYPGHNGETAITWPSPVLLVPQGPRR